MTVNYRYKGNYTPPPILSEIMSSDLDESQESIVWCKKRGFRPFGGRLASLNIKSTVQKHPQTFTSVREELFNVGLYLVINNVVHENLRKCVT